MVHRKGKARDYLKKMIDKLEQENRREEQEIASEVEEIKQAYIKEFGHPTTPQPANASAGLTGIKLTKK